MDDEIEMEMYIDYIELDKQEKSLFMTNDLDFVFDHTEKPIIHQLQTTKEEILLHYTKPVKELIIVVVNKDERSDTYDFKKIINLDIRLNNIKIETPNDEIYFKLLQPYFHNRNSNLKNIYMYSFGFDPDNSQPTGSYNFGNLKNKNLTIEIDKNDLNNIDPYVYIYANTNNVLKVSEGQSQVQFI